MSMDSFEVLQKAITETILHATQTPKEKLMEMGYNGKQLVIENYSIESISSKMHSLYNFIYDKKYIELPFVHYN